MSERMVWDVVVELRNPSPEPFAVMRVDVTKRHGDGVEGTVISLHMIKEEAEKAVHDFNNGTIQ